MRRRLPTAAAASLFGVEQRDLEAGVPELAPELVAAVARAINANPGNDLVRELLARALERAAELAAGGQWRDVLASRYQGATGQGTRRAHFLPAGRRQSACHAINREALAGTSTAAPCSRCVERLAGVLVHAAARAVLG